MEHPGLEPLSANATVREIADYLERFDIWCHTQKRITQKKKGIYLLNFIGKDAYGQIKDFAYPHSPISLSYDAIKRLLLRWGKDVNLETVERAKFNLLVQQTDQSIRDFIFQLQWQSARCNYGEQLQMQLRDRLIAGITDPDLKQKLLSLSTPTFETVCRICERHEDALRASKQAPCELLNSTRQARTKTLMPQQNVKQRIVLKKKNANIKNCKKAISVKRTKVGDIQVDFQSKKNKCPLTDIPGAITAIDVTREPIPFFWVPAANGDVPENAVYAGEDVYVGRAKHGAEYVPGKVIPSHRVTYIPDAGREHGYRSYEVLCGPGSKSCYRWVSGNSCGVPNNAIVASVTGDDVPVFIARGRVKDERVVGKVQEGQKYAYFPYGYEEHPVDKYEILVWKKKRL